MKEKPGIDVRYSSTVEEEHPQMYAHALKVTVTAAREYPDHIFLFHRGKPNNEGNVIDEFISVASPVDIEETPENAPALDDGMPYYRSNEVTLWFRNTEDLELAKKKISEDITVLVKTYNILGSDNLDKQEEIRYE